jgi:hypothetical protein
MAYAEVIADSINPAGERITTMQCRFPRMILAEANTHRLFSRNSSSSRAIPVERKIAEVMKTPFVPYRFMKNERGMQSTVPCTPEEDAEAAETWLAARLDAVDYATDLVEKGIHKQFANRILEPWTWHEWVVTSVFWENFRVQRTGPLPQPEMAVLGEQMIQARDLSTPVEVEWGGWHLPYTDTPGCGDRTYRSRLMRISAARCCRVSFTPYTGDQEDLDDDLRLYDDLTTADPMHSSPLEHPAKAVPNLGKLPVSNFSPTRWGQLRHMIEAERGIESRS